MEEIPLEYVRRVLNRMRATTPDDDEPGQMMIRKYEKLYAAEARKQRAAHRNET